MPTVDTQSIDAELTETQINGMNEYDFTLPWSGGDDISTWIHPVQGYDADRISFTIHGEKDRARGTERYTTDADFSGLDLSNLTAEGNDLKLTSRGQWKLDTRNDFKAGTFENTDLFTIEKSAGDASSTYDILSIAQSGWTEPQSNPAVEPTTSQPGFFDPSLAYDYNTDQYELYMTHDTGDFYQIGLFTSPNGSEWFRTNGVPSTQQGPNVAFSPNRDKDYISENVRDPYIVKFYHAPQMRNYLFFVGNNESGSNYYYQLNVASQSGAISQGSLYRSYTSSGPALELGPNPGDFDHKGMYDPAAIYDPEMGDDGGFKIWYVGVDQTGDDGRKRIGYATGLWDTTIDTRELVFEKHGVVLDVREDMADSMGCEDPTVIYDGTLYQMWYTGFDGSQYTIFHAT